MTAEKKDVKKLIFGLKPEIPYAIEEAVNRLRINVSFLGSDVRKIMIVSCEPNEGKSFVALNLWRQMAGAGEKTVYLDADMRNSTFAKKYKISNEDGSELKGTSHYLSSNIGLDEVLRANDLNAGHLIPNVDNIINPSMLLENVKFEEMLVFLYSHTLVLVSEAERIGNLCDGAILCVRAGFTSKGAVKEAISQLERAGCPLLGIVLNRVGASKGGYYHKYYGKYYYGHKYYGYGQSAKEK